MVYAFWHVEEPTWVTLNLADVQKHREELRWDEVWSVKSAVWSVGREECSVKCEVWSVKKAMRSEKCEVWTVKCEVWSVNCVLGRVQCEVRSVECEVCWSVKSVKSAVRSVKGEVELQMWHVKQDTTFAECTHARAWLAHGACKFYRWERSYIYIYIFKATSAQPRAGTTGMLYRKQRFFSPTFTGAYGASFRFSPKPVLSTERSFTPWPPNSLRGHFTNSAGRRGITRYLKSKKSTICFTIQDMGISVLIGEYSE